MDRRANGRRLHAGQRAYMKWLEKIGHRDPSFLATAAICLVSHLTLVGHHVLVEHVACAEHGERIHAAEANEHEATAGGGSRPARGEAGDSYRSAGGAARPSHGEDHCSLSLDRRPGTVPRPSADGLLLETAPQTDRRSPVHVAGISVEILRLAPKSSPPA